VHPTSKKPRALPHGVVAIAGTVCCMVALPIGAQSQRPLECPRQAISEAIVNPVSWSDQCFVAVNGRMPQPGRGETDSVMRDIDLDGVDELLEIRGVGAAIKQIYVFRPAARGYLYRGVIDAHPSFTVAPDAAGAPTISYLYRAGIGDLSLKRIQYRDGRFVEISSEKVRADAR
jgi:hypothetical protein